MNEVRVRGVNRIVAASMLLLVALFACTGVTARKDVLLPRMAPVFTKIEPDVERGLRVRQMEGTDAALVRVLVSDVRGALERGDRELLRELSWPLLAQLAMEGIQDGVLAGEVSAELAEAKLERLRIFGEAWERATSR